MDEPVRKDLPCVATRFRGVIAVDPVTLPGGTSEYPGVAGPVARRLSSTTRVNTDKVKERWEARGIRRARSHRTNSNPTEMDLASEIWGRTSSLDTWPL